MDGKKFKVIDIDISDIVIHPDGTVSNEEIDMLTNPITFYTDKDDRIAFIEHNINAFTIGNKNTALFYLSLIGKKLTS